MSDIALPQGRFFSVIGNVRLEAGGQTRLALLRHRLFSQYTDVELPIVTYNPIATYDDIRATMRADGRLLPDSLLLNLHEELRMMDLRDESHSGRDISRELGTSEDDTHNGYLWRRRSESHWDYFRPDGSLYLRTPPQDVAGSVWLLDQDERVVRHFDALGGLWRWWTEKLAQDAERVFLISDSRFVAVELAELDERFLLLHQMHNPHLRGNRRWHGPVSDTYDHSMTSLFQFDAMISLSERQRLDIARRYGDTNNLFVIPNPVEMPQHRTTAAERHPKQIVMIARLDRQKRLDRALAAFAEVFRAEPESRLDIYGDGPLRSELEAQAARAGLTDSVTFHGHDPAAREALWTADVFWLTSQFEGYPLSTLEAMSHGCPVLSLDMKYGPREQIDDGVDGFLFSDVDSLVDKTIEIFADRSILVPMREAALAKARAHGHERFLRDWARTLKTAVEQQPHRLHSLEADGPSLDELSWDRTAFSGNLTITPDPATADPKEARLSWHAWSPDRDEFMTLPLEVRITEKGFDVSGEVTDIERLLPGADAIHFGFDIIWANMSIRFELGELRRRSIPRWIMAGLRRALRG